MEVNQRNLMAGNYIDVMGTFQIVLGIVFREELGNWFIQHTGSDSENIPIPSGIEFTGKGIYATKEWKKWLGVEKRRFPKHIKFVHEIQNYCLWHFGIMLSENVDFDLLPEICNVSGHSI